MKESKKGLLISIIILIILFGLATFIGLYYKNFKPITTKISNTPKIEIKPNPNHEFYFDNKLYFYDENTLLGVYPCQYDKCDVAINTLDDALYPLDSDTIMLTNDPINNRYVFVSDYKENSSNEPVILYDLKDNKTIATYAAMKIYESAALNNIYIVQGMSGNWGALTIKETVSVLLKFKYEYIGVLDSKETTTIESFVVKLEDKWAIVSNKDKLLSKYISDPIYTYNEKVIETKVNDEYNLYDYEGVALNNDYRYKLIVFDNDYIEFVTTTNKIFVYDFNKKKMISAILNLYETDFSETALYPPYKVTVVDDSVLMIDIYTSQLYGSKLSYNYSLI